MCDLCESFDQATVQRWEREAEELILHPDYPAALALMSAMCQTIAENNRQIEEFELKGLSLLAVELYRSGQELMGRGEDLCKEAYGEQLGLMAYMHAANELYPLEGREAMSMKYHMEWMDLLMENEAERAFKSHRIIHMLNTGEGEYKPFDPDAPREMTSA